MKLLYAHWMQELDAETINGIGIPSIVLMENASRGAADFFAREFPLPQFKHVIVVAGKGNNGGDGFAAGRILFQKGYNVHFVLLSNPEKLNPDPKINFDILNRLKLPITIIEKEDHLKALSALFKQFHHSDTFLIDALFGTGLNNPVRPGLYANAISAMNQSPFKIAAIDLPSGLSDAFLPDEAVHIDADITATFHSLKTAHLHPDGNKHCGHIHIIDIGIPHLLEQREAYYIDIIEPQAFENLFATRSVDAHKGSFGHTLTICGSVEKPGAGILSSYAALKSGTGLCTAAVCEENRTLVPAVHPELMTLIFKNSSQLSERFSQFNTILTGPGLGDTDETAQLISLLLETAPMPVIMDADALNVLQRPELKKKLNKKRSYPLVLTPHPGEFSRLTGQPVNEILKKRISLSREFAMQHSVYLILKGHHTLIATPGGHIYVNQTGNAGMATAGSGDVLSGMIAGMVSQYCKSYPIETILQAAVFLHGYAGDLAARKVGEVSLTAGDILNHIPSAIQQLHEYRSPYQVTR